MAGACHAPRQKIGVARSGDALVAATSVFGLSDKTLIVSAAAHAQKAADFILGKTPADTPVSAAQNAMPPEPVAVAA